MSVNKIVGPTLVSIEEGETLSALENKRNVQVTFAFDDNLCNSKKVNHISNNNDFFKDRANTKISKQVMY